MSSTDYLAGSIYHMVHFNNLESIFQRRALLSHARMRQEEIEYQSIAFESVQQLRERIFVWDYKRELCKLHSYVPFYFAIRPPMLYVQQTHGVQDDVVILEVSRSILSEQGVLFTDGNASNQQLSNQSNEIVQIMPATVNSGPCNRLYLPDGPHGTNAHRSNFYADIAFLDRLRWDIINDLWSRDPDKVQIRSAEVLLFDLVPLKHLQGIIVKTQGMVQTVNRLITKCRLEGRIPQAVWKPSFFVQ